MSYKNNILVMVFLLIGSVNALAKGVVESDIKEHADFVKKLDWISDCGSENICGGYYSEPKNIASIIDPELYQDAPIKVKASKPALLTKKGISTVEGDVVLVQPGREAKADRVKFFRNSETHKISHGVLEGNIGFREHDKLILAKRGEISFIKKVYILKDVIYRALANTPTGLANVWGNAKQALVDQPGILKLTKATYTSCPPDAVVWDLLGTKVNLDRNTGWGYATNAVVFVKKVPIFYFPYVSFPIDNERKSGFLTPSPSYSHNSGFGIDLPYYFNLAPNYDAILNPRYFTSRGILLQGSLNYLTPTSLGSASIKYIPYDSKFVDFRDSATVSNSEDQRALDALKNSSSWRGLIGLKHDTHFNQHWSGSLDVNYSTDDYFIQDFSNLESVVDDDQLLNQADVRYVNDNWDFLGRLQIFQTLHSITKSRSYDQYKRLPQLSLSGDFPDSLGVLNYRLDSEIINFLHRENFYDVAHKPVIGGTRFNLSPSVEVPFDWKGVYAYPKLELKTVNYGIHDHNNDDKDSNAITRFYPLFSMDSGIIFNRSFNNGYTQTLEPRIFYLFVPKRNQKDVPIFDTYLPAFDFNQLFCTNRFTGIDRIGDANQVSVAVTSRFLDDWGQEKFNFGVGQIFAFDKHEVIIDKDNSYLVPFNLDPLEKNHLSPLVGHLQSFINNKLNISFDMAWDPSEHRFNTINTNLQYLESSNRVFNIWYNYALNGDQLLQDIPINLSRLGGSFGWKVGQKWNIIGSLNYNLGYKRPQNYLCGLEYESCCWALRFVHNRKFVGIGADGNSNYDSGFYVQFLLKGLGNLDLGGFGDLGGHVRGYRDNFVGGV